MGTGRDRDPATEPDDAPFVNDHRHVAARWSPGGVDADRSVSAILRSAKEILASQPNASVEDIATAAGVSRQTVYAHFRTREAVLSAVIDELTGEAVAEMDAARLDEGPAAAALLRLLDASWRTLQRYPQFMAAAATVTDPEADHTRHQAVFDHLDQVLTRGQRSGEFADDLDLIWLATAVVTLGHAAGDAVHTGRMTLTDATTALATTVLRVCGLEPSEITKLVVAAPEESHDEDGAESEQGGGDGKSEREATGHGMR